MTPPALSDSRSVPALDPDLAHLTQTPQAYLSVLAQYLSAAAVVTVEAVVETAVAAVAAAAEVGIGMVGVVEAALPRLLLLRD